MQRIRRLDAKLGATRKSLAGELSEPVERFYEEQKRAEEGIHVRIGSQADSRFLHQRIQEFGSFDSRFDHGALDFKEFRHRP